MAWTFSLSLVAFSSRIYSISFTVSELFTFEGVCITDLLMNERGLVQPIVYLSFFSKPCRLVFDIDFRIGVLILSVSSILFSH